jgi:hypothetical protein
VRRNTMHVFVATTYDPLRVLKRLYCLSLLSSEWQLQLPATR